MYEPHQGNYPKFNLGMESGRHYANSFVIYGENKHREIAQFVASSSYSILLIDSNMKLESMDLGMEFNLVIEVYGEPSLEEVRRIESLLPSTPCIVVAIGGGATMDLAKGVVCARHYPGESRIGYGASGDLTSRLEHPKDFLVLLPTTIGSGSEGSRYFVLFQDGKKLANRSWQALPRLVIMDPVLISYLNPITARIQLFDCWSHLAEVSLSRLELSPINFLQILAAKKHLMDIVKSDIDLTNLKTRLTLQSISFVGGNAISNTRTGALHTVGEALASQISMPHVWSLYFSSINWPNLVAGDARSFPMAFIENPTKLLEETLGDLDFWTTFLKNEVESHLTLNQSEVANFDMSVFESSVLSDKVLWEKEHPVCLKSSEISDYLTRTLESVSNFKNF